MISFKNYVNLLEVKQLSPNSIVNGQVPEQLMVPVDSQGNKLIITVANSFKEAAAAAKQATGEDLLLVGPNSSYRTFAQQELMARRYGIGQAARPGRSNHGFGLSVDIVKNKAWEWFVKNGPSYGFYQLNSTNERHHFDYKKPVPEYNGQTLVFADGSSAPPPSTGSSNPQGEEPYEGPPQEGGENNQNSLPGGAVDAAAAVTEFDSAEDALNALSTGFTSIFQQ